MSWIHQAGRTLILNIQVKRFAQVEGVLGEKNGWLEIGITAPPEKGKANKALVKFLAKKLHIPLGDIRILRGATQNQKVIAIDRQIAIPHAVALLTKEKA